MIEREMAFYDIHDNMNLAEAYVFLYTKYIILVLTTILIAI